jgi:hypothetical protein
MGSTSLSHNDIKTLADLNIPSLEVIDFENNMLTTESAKMFFNNKPNLKIVDLTNNMIDSFGLLETLPETI